ncbi:PREDICTED: C-type lectin domain family 2 member D-like [Thamnophis sirtalis]|uniref:C-type lectin domain family 2 member D-like n=1 Tax=Thamnophis sirtalis TaxID=35019 RepID=A0A6I9YT22_9SAUR|nr:PREDICTED: C-type lectin domain family 2 member D-like [Thamnophis sirtalis]
MSGENTGGEGAEIVPLKSEMRSEPSEHRNAGGEGAEGDDECREHCIGVPTGPPSGCLDGIKNTAHRRKCIIALVILVVVLIIIIIIVISLVCRNQCQSSLYLASQKVSCMDPWITYKGKYFYIAREEKDWFMSLKTCSLFNASLAVIDTQKELDFWVHFLGPFDYWFGLSREINKVWKWANGTEFRNQFPIHGEGLCAYINAEGASSTKCTVEKGFLCSCNKVAAILAKTTSSKVGSS